MLLRENEKALVFILANRVMAHADMSKKERKEVLALAARVILYDHGYKQIKGVEGLTRTWATRLDAAFVSGADQHPLKAHYKGRTAYTDKLEKACPGYIRELYRYAERTVSNQASFEDLARTMNSKSNVPGEQRPETRFNAMNLYRWFHQHGGKEKSPLEKPYLTKDQMKARKKWCKFEKNRMAEWGKNFYCCFLDEKWFYTTSRRRKVKVLPPGPGEDADAVAPPPLTTVSRRHAIKVCKSRSD